MLGKYFRFPSRWDLEHEAFPAQLPLSGFMWPHRAKFRRQVVLQSIWGTALSDAVGPMPSSGVTAELIRSVVLSPGKCLGEQVTFKPGQTLGVSCNSSVSDLYCMSVRTPGLLASVLALLDSDTLSLFLIVHSPTKRLSSKKVAR